MLGGGAGGQGCLLSPSVGVGLRGCAPLPVGVGGWVWVPLPLTNGVLTLEGGFPPRKRVFTSQKNIVCEP